MPGALVIALAPPSAPWLSGLPPTERPVGGCDPRASTALLLERAGEREREAPPLARATTDAEGRFRLEGLAEGGVLLWAEKGKDLGLREAPAGSTGVDVRLRPGQVMTGEVRDERGGALPGVRVLSLVRNAGRFAETLTREDGRFTLGPLPWSEELLLLSKEGFMTTSTVFRAWGDRRALILSEARSVFGHVRDAAGPVAGATVQASGSVPLSTVRTDAQGLFSFESLCPDRTLLQASHEGRQARQWALATSAEKAQAVDLLLAPGLRLSGRVTDASGRPVSAAELTLSAVEPTPRLELQATTDAQGRFLLEPFTPGGYTLALRAEHFAPVRLSPQLFEASRELDLLLLEPSERVEGVVVDERGAPVEGVRLQLLPPDGRQIPQSPPRCHAPMAPSAWMRLGPESGGWR